MDYERENTPAYRFEEAILEIGIVTACEWFGHQADSEFTKETIRVLRERHPQKVLDNRYRINHEAA